MSQIAVQTGIHIPSGRTVNVYQHRERKSYVDTKDYRTEYPVAEVQLR